MSGYASGNRREILWVGSYEPHALQAAATLKGLSVRQITLEELAQTAPLARLLVLDIPDHDPDFAERARDAVSLALTHGLRVALACGLEIEPGAPACIPDPEQVKHWFATIGDIRDHDEF